MASMDYTPVARRVASAAGRAIRPALSTTRFLATVMVPVSLAVLFLDKSGILGYAALYLDPVMRMVGLSGESALVFLSSILLNIYSAIAVIGNLSLSAREITILATMCLIAHNLIVECAVMKKTGSSVTKMAVLRIGTALFAGWLLNRFLPLDFAPPVGEVKAAPFVPAALFSGLSFEMVPSLLRAWALETGGLILKIAVIVTALMIVQKVMDEFAVMQLLGRVTAPLMLILGLPVSAGFLWIVANVIGLAYGSAIMIERAESGKMTLSDGDLFNHHVGISHSLLEDTILFMAIGVPLFWAIIPRLLLAFVVVWLERVRRMLFRRSFRVGTM